MTTHPNPAPVAGGPSDAELEWATDVLGRMSEQYSRVVVGQENLKRALFAGLLARGHVLVESVPGLAKTLAAHTLARCVDARFSRVQCTPDLLPSDIIGTQIFNPATATFTTELGPVHANFVLLDEINRSSAKTQSAMLEAMQERQTTIGGESIALPDPFMVMATQNPIEEEGTYLLPQAQMDRFLLKEVIGYPTPAQELAVLDRMDGRVFEHPARPVATAADVRRLQDVASRVRVDDAVRRYIVQIVHVTRDPAAFVASESAECLEYGASPRASIAFLQAARAIALLAGRGYATPDDVVAVRHAVLRHRLMPTFEAVANGVSIDGVIDEIVKAVPTP